MSNSQQDLLILLGILASIAVAVAVVWAGSRMSNAQVAKNESIKATHAVTDAAVQLLEGSLKESNLREEAMVREVRQLKTQVAYLQKTVEALARQIRDSGQVPKIPNR